MDKNQAENEFYQLAGILKNERNADGFWTGKLSPSALSTAVALAALKIDGKSGNRQAIGDGLNWLFAHANPDGGFGDTPESRSNVSTSLLCYAAIRFCCEKCQPVPEPFIKLGNYLENQKINFSNPEKLVKSVLNFYGKDLTFSVPILTLLTICGATGREAYNFIPRLPFELSLFPYSFYRMLNLQVVSYALPALIAVGIAVFKNRRGNGFSRYFRGKAINPSLRKLEKMMPDSGGFLEAIPLTAFVSLCLISAGFSGNRVVEKGIGFLKKQQNPDGSWPIDSNLSTWVTTLSIKSVGEKVEEIFTENERNTLKQHLLDIQYREKHPFNQAKPGGWGWTNLTGSVPDADDTSGAILALISLYGGTENEKAALKNGCSWLMNLQNRDGGFPTFSKGWGKLPFDSSCADITGHALNALSAGLAIFGGDLPAFEKRQFQKSIKKAIGFLGKNQDNEGAWLPLWFGNQQVKNHKNPVYGTARVAVYIGDSLALGIFPEVTRILLETMLKRGQKYLASVQNPDGSWGGSSGISGTIEETALALSALSTTIEKNSCLNGFMWLKNEVGTGGFKSSPIGLYFSALWYDEKIYPLVFYLEALRRLAGTA